MWVPAADSGSEILIGRPHIGKTHPISLGQFTSRVVGLHTFGDLARILSQHRQLRSEFIIRHHSLYRASSFLPESILSHARWYAKNARAKPLRSVISYAHTTPETDVDGARDQLAYMNTRIFACHNN